MGVIEFNYLENFILGWQKVEIGKSMWKNWLHMLLAISTFCHKILPISTFFSSENKIN